MCANKINKTTIKLIKIHRFENRNWQAFLYGDVSILDYEVSHTHTIMTELFYSLTACIQRVNNITIATSYSMGWNQVVQYSLSIR